MNIKIKILFILLINLIIVTTGCTNNKEPRIGIRLMHKVNNNMHILEWRVRNASEHKPEITFKNGDIINYKIKNYRTNKIITNVDNKEMTDTITLKPGEEYKTSIELHNDTLEKGKYDAVFWATSKSGDSRMRINFIVE